MTRSSAGNSRRGVRHRFRELWYQLRDQLPLRRKHYTKLRDKFDVRLAVLERKLAGLEAATIAVADHLLLAPASVASTPLLKKIPVSIDNAREICLFVAFAPQQKLKGHVVDHIFELAKQGVSTILIVNTSDPLDGFEIPAQLIHVLAGCFIRPNVGFDFAAWAQAYQTIQLPTICERLFLINDSVIGPLHSTAYAKLFADIRASDADLLGLTENSWPCSHVQSYFLVINQRLLHAVAFHSVMKNVVNMTTKEDVIAIYETQLTRLFRAYGFRCEALFRQIATDQLETDDTIYHWAELIERGFPFIKARVLERVKRTPEAGRLIPRRFLRDWFYGDQKR